MKRLFVCCDGTWNSPRDIQDGVPVPTNVLKFYNCVLSQDTTDPRAPIAQLRYYHPGIGAGEGTLRRLWDGATGTGLSQNIKTAYKWLSDHYDPGDQIFLLGFSRGAFTVRSLSGMIYHCGLVSVPTWAEVEQAYDLYRLRPTRADTERKQATFRAEKKTDERRRIHFLGVWDTVGALGIPRKIDWLSIGSRRNRFHNTGLAPIVTHAFHAIAIDEMRSSFSPTLWTTCPPTVSELKQVWFTGVHADVGGGYKETELSDCTLKWMIEQAERCGAAMDDHMVGQIRGDCRGVLHDSLQGFFKFVGSQPRSMPDLDAPGMTRFNETINGTVFDRRARPPIAQTPYRPSVLLAKGQSTTFTVYARDYWNWTGIFLEAGATYEFEVDSTQIWKDAMIETNADGYRGNPIQWLFSWLKRFPGHPWFCLTGAVSDTGNPTVSGDPPPMTMLWIGTHATHTCHKEGYLYCFANDASGFYFNNRRAVTARITRV